MTQSLLLGGISQGIAAALEIEGGFFDRLAAAPIPRVAIVLGRLGAAAVHRRGPGRLLPGPRADLRRPHRGRRRAARWSRWPSAIVAGIGFGALGVALALRAEQRLDAAGHLPAGLRDPVPLLGVLPARSAGVADRHGRAVQPAQLHRRRACATPIIDSVQADARSSRAWPPAPASAASAIAAGRAGPARKAARRMSHGAAHDPGAHPPRAQRDPPRAHRRASRACWRPTIFMLGLSAVFGAGGATCRGFGDATTSGPFIVPVGLLQGAGFTGAATGVNLARDIEQGWFDRLLVAPVSPADAADRHRAVGVAARPAARDVPADRRLLARRALAGRRRPADRLRADDGHGRRDGLLRGDRRPALPHPAGRAAHADGQLRRRRCSPRPTRPTRCWRAGCSSSPTSTRSPTCWRACGRASSASVTWSETWPALRVDRRHDPRARRARPARHEPRRRRRVS